VGDISQPISVAKGTQTKTITGLTNGTTYTFTVKAVDTVGNESGGVSESATPLAMVNALNLTGKVIAPVSGSAPNTTAIDEPQYTGAIAWQKDDGSSFSGNFTTGTVYKAIVTLTAKTGFTFTGVGANSFSYTGATAANAADSGTVTITFPETAVGGQPITLNFADSGSGAFTQDTFTVIKGGSPASQAITITLEGSWSSQEWRVDGFVKPTATPFTVNAANYTVGGHALQVTVKDSSNKYWSKTLSFTVTAPVMGLTLNKTDLTLPVTGTETLIATVSPANAANKTVTWSSSDTNAAMVNSSGLITAVSVGSATITATSVGNSFTAACTVTVTAGGSQPITLTFDDPGSGVFTQGTFSVKKTGTPANQGITLIGTWASQEWRVDGFVKPTAAPFTVYATDYTVGGHTLQVTVKDAGGNYWSKTLQFTVTEN
jgi:hypothetical protein